MTVRIAEDQPGELLWDVRSLNWTHWRLSGGRRLSRLLIGSSSEQTARTNGPPAGHRRWRVTIGNRLPTN
jgi:hypothetical protein